MDCPNPKCTQWVELEPPDDNNVISMNVTRFVPCPACKAQMQVSAFRRKREFTWSSWFVITWRDSVKGAWHEAPGKKKFYAAQRAANA